MPYLEEEGWLDCDEDGCEARESVKARTVNMLRDLGWLVPWASEGEPAWCPKHNKVGVVPEQAVPRDDADQPLPVPNAHRPIQPLVMADIEARMAVGISRYGTPLQAWNGRDMLKDAYDEAMDLCVYLRGMLFERDGE